MTSSKRERSPGGRNQGKMRSRGYLPHIDRWDRPQFITYRLADSLPAQVVEKIRRETGAGKKRSSRLEKILDAGYGACWLANPRFAEVLAENLHYHNGKKYRLLDWVIMPNHVHVAYDRPRCSMEEILHSWKSYTAHRLKPLTDLKEDEPFWQREYFDRYVRDEEHLGNVQNYIYMNPVKAGLVEDPFEWKWSSLQRFEGNREKLRSWWRAE